MNPFDLPGPEFIKVYFLVAAGATVLGAALILILRWRFGRDSETCPLEDHPDLDRYEIAYLTGGEALALNAAIADLIRRGLLAVEPEGGVLQAGKRQPGVRRVKSRGKLSNRLEAAVHESLSADAVESAPRLTLRTEVALACSQMKDRLEEYGLLLSGVSSARLRHIPKTVALAVIVFGLIKVMVGYSRDRDVFGLVFLCGFFGFLIVVSLDLFTGRFLKSPHRSDAGNRLLTELKKENEALEHLATRKPDMLAAGELALAVGLFGTGVLAGPAFAEARSILQTATETAGSAFWSWGGGGCGGGCGGGGCGGGCGGCGG